ncbi:MAG: ATP-binding cassette domain-containing protein [Bacteroidales bacterium]|jgi:cell division transport system ATP-binding protein|nr:ATP-binding cassette domain-containing protein [Bacteroidales bacterium]MDD4703230.1 ATP-binding cassette domain-containing protein [Bacteroidales bacterium]MDX9797801.1 ATP-binding cassette domain-containing protein [Bacteroidales bacterium]
MSNEPNTIEKLIINDDSITQIQEIQKEPKLEEETSAPIIKFTDATLSHGKMVLTNVNLTVEEGEFAYIIGKTGTGKSTLLKTIYADLPLKSGEGEVCGFSLKNIKKKNIPLLRRKLGIVFQDFQLLQDRNIFDNIVFVLKSIGINDKEEIRTRVIAALEEVGMASKENEMPYSLSEGEMQRVAIARAIVNHPKLIIADEPTGNLDPITSEEIVNLLMKINKEYKTTILMVTHDYLVIEKFRSRVICCEDGKVI